MLLPRLIDKSFCQRTELVDATVAQERPPTAHLFAAKHVDVDNCCHLDIGRRLIEQLALWARHKTTTPETYAVSHARRVEFEPGAIDRNHGDSVSHGMTSLDGYPCLALTSLLRLGVAALPAYRRGLDEHLGTFERHNPRCLRIPLVPANEDA